MMPNFDSNKFYLGSLCKRGHDWSNTGKTLRRFKGNICPVCHAIATNNGRKTDKFRENRRKKRAEYYQKIKEEGLKTYLGKLCKYGHNWQDTSKSLRSYRNHNCVMCEREKCLAYSKTEAGRLAHKRAYEKMMANPEKREQKRLGHMKDYRKHIEKRRISQKLYRSKPGFRDLEKARVKRYRSSEKGKLAVTRWNHRRLAAKKHNHSSAYSSQELKAHLAKFEQCVYCGRKDSITIDHFLPISHGGGDCLGNIAGACLFCNSSKRDRDPKEWYEKQPFYSRKQWLEILRILGKTDANYVQMPLF